jgi:glycerol-3-phosphate dehydrogenase
VYGDVIMDDTRLAIAVARDAAAHGAEILTRSELVAARPDPSTGRQVVEVGDGGLRRDGGQLSPRLIINATGGMGRIARGATLLGMLQPGSSDPPRLLRPTRGTHLVYPALTESHALVTLAGDGACCS